MSRKMWYETAAVLGEVEITKKRLSLALGCHILHVLIARQTEVASVSLFLKVAGQWGRVLGMNPKEIKEPRLLEALLYTPVTLAVFCPLRVLQSLPWGPDEPPAERLDGNPHPGHCVPLPAIRGQACLR